MINEDHVKAFGIASKHEITYIYRSALNINLILSKLFEAANISLVDFKIEFGRLKIGGQTYIILADEISPDGCRLWDMSTNNKLDKDRFRQDLGRIEESYNEVYNRLMSLNDTLEKLK